MLLMSLLRVWAASYRFSKTRAMSAKKKSHRTTPGAERHRCRSSSQVLFEGLQLYFGACARDCEDTPKSWIDIKFAILQKLKQRDKMIKLLTTAVVLRNVSAVSQTLGPCDSCPFRGSASHVRMRRCGEGRTATGRQKN